MTKFQIIDLNKCIPLHGEYFNEFMDEVELCEHYTYPIDEVKSIVGYKHPDISDLKIEIFEDHDSRYLYSIVSEELSLDMVCDFTGHDETTLCQLLGDKLMTMFNYDRYSDFLKFLEDGVTDHFVESVEGTSENSYEKDSEDDYIYESYIFLTFGDIRKHGPKYDMFEKQTTFAKTIVIDKYAIYMYEGKPCVIYTGNSADSVVADVYKAEYDMIQSIKSEGLRLEKVGDSDAWCYIHDDPDTIMANGERIKNVNEISTDEKYKDCDYQDWLHYLKVEVGSEIDYDAIDTFKMPTTTVQNASNRNTDDVKTYDNSIYSREQYAMVLNEFNSYLEKKNISLSPDLGTYDTRLAEWFISEDAADVRLKLEV